MSRLSVLRLLLGEFLPLPLMGRAGRNCWADVVVGLGFFISCCLSLRVGSARGITIWRRMGW